MGQFRNNMVAVNDFDEMKTGWTAYATRTISVASFLFVMILLSLYYLTKDETQRYFLPAINAGYSSNDVALRGYLVDGPKCNIPDVDPYDKEIRSYIHTVAHVPCSKRKLLTYIEKYNGYATLIIDSNAVNAYSKQGVQCCYSNITRGHSEKVPDDSVSISKCKDFEDRVNVTEEFLLVKCVTNKGKKEVYKNTHAVVRVTPEVRKKIEENSKNNNKLLSVLLFGIDSISRLNMLRTMPRTLEYLNENRWIELKGYTKIADNTFPNLMALLTGIEGDAAYNVCLPTKLYHLENCSFIWTKFKQHGYVTAYAEDAATISTFNYHKVGFAQKPTDYYLRPFMLTTEKQLKSVFKYGFKYCIGPVVASERILSYAKDFATTFVNDPKFGLFWMNSFSHNDINMPSSMDSTVLKFIKELDSSGVGNNSIMVLFSDHGMRFGDFRFTRQGWLEERLPFIYIHVPKWFQTMHPLKYRSLMINSNRLTTPYDLHMTLEDILVISGKTNSVTQSSGCPKCQSLFTEIDNARSCEDAAISPHWCMCTAFKKIASNNPVVKQAAQYIMVKLQKYVDDAGPEIAKKCAKLSLNRIIISQIGEPWYRNETYYLLFIETLPGHAKFEATVSRNHAVINNSVAEMFNLHSSISRLDSYAGQSKCVHDGNLKKYCYCR